MMKFKFISCFIICFCISNLSFSQIKDEREWRVDLTAFPENARELMLNLPKKAKRIRHYKEIDGKSQSFETKLKFEKHWFSIEFSTLGILEDIEVVIKERQLEKTLEEAINSYLESESSKFDLIKIQEQYIYSDSISEAEFINDILRNRSSISSNFEIIVAIKINRQWLLKEMTFNNKGEFIDERELKPESYEYIMY